MEIPLTRRQYAVFLAVFLVIAVSSFAVASRLRFEFVREAPLNHYQLQANGIMHGKIGLCNATGDFIYIIDQSTLRPGVPQAYWGPLPTLLHQPQVQAAVQQYKSASPEQQAAWTDAYGKAVADAKFVGGRLVVPAGDYGPVATIIAAETAMARSGALDGALLSSKQFYGTDYTKPLLFIADGDYFDSLGTAQHLGGDQWGMMNETGRYPGQAWLWLYTFWYQVPAIGNSDNADIMVFAIMIVLTALLALVPFIPGLRSIPRWTHLYRLIWRNYYREVEGGGSSGSPPQVEGSAPEPAPV